MTLEAFTQDMREAEEAERNRHQELIDVLTRIASALDKIHDNTKPITNWPNVR